MALIFSQFLGRVSQKNQKEISERISIKIGFKFSLFGSLPKCNRPKSPTLRDVPNNKDHYQNDSGLYGGAKPTKLELYILYKRNIFSVKRFRNGLTFGKI